MMGGRYHWQPRIKLSVGVRTMQTPQYLSVKTVNCGCVRILPREEGTYSITLITAGKGVGFVFVPSMPPQRILPTASSPTDFASKSM